MMIESHYPLLNHFHSPAAAAAAVVSRRQQRSAAAKVCPYSVASGSQCRRLSAAAAARPAAVRCSDRPSAVWALPVTGQPRSLALQLP